MAEDESLTGKTLGGYEVGRKVGMGGMAIVYEGFDRSSNRKVAIKVLPKSLLTDEETVKRFDREAAAASKLEHPNVIKVYNTGEEGGLHYFVMEYLEGKTLEELLSKKGNLPPAKVVDIARQVAEALKYAHREGLIHRDVKPSNIMISGDEVKVTDFGMVKVVKEPKFTKTGAVLGTPLYMSPEQARGKAVDTRTDIYSLGVVMYEMLTGRVPFDADTSLGVIRKVIEKIPPLPRLICPQVPLDLEAVVLRAMEKEQGERYQSVQELLDDLTKFERGIPIKIKTIKESLSASDVELIDFTKEFLRQKDITSKTLTMFPADHPSVSRSLDKLLTVVRKLLKGRKAISFNEVANRLIVEGVPLDEKETRATEFALDFINWRINGISFLKGITKEEVRAFLLISSKDPKVLSQEGGFASLLFESDVSHIKVNEVYYEKVSREEKEARLEEERLEEMAITNYFLGKLGDLRGKEGELIERIEGDAKGVGQLISRIVKQVDAPEGYDEIEAGAPMAVEIFQKLGNELLSNSPGGWRSFRKNLSQVLLSLEPELQKAILRSEVLTEVTGDENIIEGITSELSDDLIVDMVASEYRGEDISLYNLKRLLEKLIKESGKRNRILPQLRERLHEKGMSATDYQWLIEERHWSQLSIDEKAEELFRTEPKFYIRIGIGENVAPVVEDLLAMEKEDVARGIVEKLIKNLEDRSEKVRLRCSEEMPPIIALLLRKEKFDILQEIVSALLNHLEERELHLSVGRNLAEVASACLEKEMIGLPLEILKRFRGDDELVEKVATADTIEPLIERIKHQVGARKDNRIDELLIQMGDRIVPSLVCAITDEDNLRLDPFDAFLRRRRVAEILKGIGRISAERLKEMLTDRRWWVVKNVVEVLSDLKDERVVSSLIVSLKHPDSQVRRAAICALEKIGGREAVEMLILALRDKELENRKCARWALENLGGERAKSALKFLNEGRVSEEKLPGVLVEMLMNMGALTERSLEEALRDQEKKKGFLGQVLVEGGYSKEEDVTMCLASLLGFRYLPLRDYEIEPEVLSLIPPSEASRAHLLPAEKIGHLLVVTMADPLNEEVIDRIRLITRCNLDVCCSTPSDILNALKKYYGMVSEEKIAIFSSLYRGVYG